MAEQLTAQLPSLAGRERRARLLAVARRETTLAPVGLAVISLHVLDDSFFQPQASPLNQSNTSSGWPGFSTAIYSPVRNPRSRRVLRLLRRRRRPSSGA
jgi:hypothetical protein